VGGGREAGRQGERTSERKRSRERERSTADALNASKMFFRELVRALAGPWKNVFQGKNKSFPERFCLRLSWREKTKLVGAVSEVHGLDRDTVSQKSGRPERFFLRLFYQEMFYLKLFGAAPRVRAGWTGILRHEHTPHGGLRMIHQKSTGPAAIELKALAGTNLGPLPPRIWRRAGAVLDLRTTTSQSCEAVPSRART
jgi:hypothetical protein